MPVPEDKSNGNIVHTGKAFFKSRTGTILLGDGKITPGSIGARLYVENNGLGKARLMVAFATGAAIQLAIEP